jgi:hypothetical protein
MIKAGIDVFGIGTGPLRDSVDRDYVGRLYKLWLRRNNHSGAQTGNAGVQPVSDKSTPHGVKVRQATASVSTGRYARS